MSVLPCPIPAHQGHEGSSKERQEKTGPSGVRSHAGPKVLGPCFSRIHPAEPSTSLGRWTGGAIPGGSLAHCSSSCEASTGSPSPRGRGVPSVGNCVGPSGGAGSWPRGLTVVRVVSWPKAQAFQKGKKEKQSCGCWRSTRWEHGVLPLSLRARLRSGGRSVSEASRSGRTEVRWRRRPASVGSLRFWCCSVGRQRGEAKVSEQGVFVPCGAGWCGCLL